MQALTAMVEKEIAEGRSFDFILGHKGALRGLNKTKDLIIKGNPELAERLGAMKKKEEQAQAGKGAGL